MESYRRELLLDSAGIEARLDALAARLRPRLHGHAVTVIPVLGGAMIFAADLVRRLDGDVVIDFLRMQSYGDAQTPQREPVADWLPRREHVVGRTVLLLDDILDTGRTMLAARRLLLEELGAASVLIVVMIDKPVRRAVSIRPDDCAILVEDDRFLVGYGLDLAGRFRGLPAIYALASRAEEAGAAP